MWAYIPQFFKEQLHVGTRVTLVKAQVPLANGMAAIALHLQHTRQGELIQGERHRQPRQLGMETGMQRDAPREEGGTTWRAGGEDIVLLKRDALETSI